MYIQSINNLIVILFFGALILLTFINITNPLKINIKGNRSFALFLLLYASFWLEEIIQYSGFKPLNPSISTIIHGTQIITPLVFYISIMYYTRPDFKISKIYAWHIIIPIVYMLFQGIMYFNPSLQQALFIPSIVLILTQALFYTSLAYLSIRKHQKRIVLYSSDTSGINLNWLEYIILQIIVLSVMFVLHNIFISTTNLSLHINIIQLITVYFIAYHSFTQKEIFPVRQEQRETLILATNESDDNTNEKKKVISDEELKLYKDQLIQIMNDNKPYLDSEINLVRLSELLRVTPHQLSYIINTGFKVNFFQFVNGYRVEKAKELLQNGDEDLTMLAIAYEAGFNSKTAFNTTFKKLTRKTPSEFKKKLTDL